jgi:hypothetical protein
MRAHRTALLCLLSLLPTSALAETRYDVEILVIQQDSDRDATEERWRPVIAVPDFERAGTFEGDTGNPLPDDFERLSTADTRLGSTLDRLESSSRYRVLRHLRWRQPALEPGKSVPIRLRSGDPIAIEAPLEVIERPVPAADNESMDEKLEEGEGAVTGESGMADNALGSDLGLTLTRSPHARDTQRVSVHPLDGTIELVVSRYLHIHADLYFTRAVDWDEAFMARGGIAGPAIETPDGESAGGEASDDEAADNGEESLPIVADVLAPAVARGPDDEPMLSFPFSQSRRMRSGELHYLDHPLIGILVLVTPYEEDEDTGNGSGDG